jgi:hypothetical protein
MEPTAATAALAAQEWRRVVIVAAMVSALVGSVVAEAGRTAASEPVADLPETRELVVQAPALDPSCREYLGIPKRGWVCVNRR